jgi:hypothetical protein
MEILIIISNQKNILIQFQYINDIQANEISILALSGRKELNIINYNREKDIIIGIENSMLGLKSTCQVTNCIFGCCYNYSIMNNFDGVYYFNDYIYLHIWINELFDLYFTPLHF